MVKESQRKNCDKSTNSNGMKLLNLCKGFEMQIANGRFTGDFWGNPKSFVKALNSEKVKLSNMHCTQLLETGLIESSGQMIQKIFRETAEIALYPNSNKQRIK